MQSPDGLRQSFYLLIILIGLTSIGVAWLVYRASQPKSGFKLREADRKRPNGPAPQDTVRVEHQRKDPKTGKGPILLTGLKIDGAPHEILGISLEATEDQIQTAYLGLIKRFHPDKVGPPGSREWQDAQKIAAALNDARTRMLDRVQRS